jgi:glycyl-tRNA synthetase beta subunit
MAKPSGKSRVQELTEELEKARDEHLAALQPQEHEKQLRDRVTQLKQQLREAQAEEDRRKG